MPDLNKENSLNEFEYTDEEKAELAKLDEINGDSDELVAQPSDLDDGVNIDPKPEETDPELTVDENLIDDLLKPEPEEKTELAKKQEPEPDPAPEPTVEEVEPLPNFDEQLAELDQQKQEAQGKVDDTLDQLAALAEKFDDGEISQGKYDVEKLKLERELRRVEKELDKVEQAHENLSSEAETKINAYQDSRRTVWRNDLIDFLQDSANEVIANNQHVAEQFDALLQSMGQSGVFEGLNNHQILQSVRNQLSFRVPELGKTQYNPEVKTDPAKAKPPKPTQKANIPASLSQMNAQEMTADDPFAYIRKLSGVKYEEAISKLSEEQQEKFLFG